MNDYAFTAILLPAGYSRGGEVIRDIAWVTAPSIEEARDRARHLLSELHPHARVWALTEHTEAAAA